MPFYIQPIREFLVRPALPAAAHSLDRARLQHPLELGTASSARCSGASTRPVAGVRIQPRAHAGPRLPGDARSAPPPILATWRSTATPARRYDSRVTHEAGRRRRQADRLFLRRVRPHRMPADLFGRPGRSLRRSSEIVQRSGLPLVGVGCSISRATSASPSIPTAGSRSAIRSTTSTRCPSRPVKDAAGRISRCTVKLPTGDVCHPGVEHRRRPHHAVSARHQHSRERAAAGSRHHRSALRRRHRHAHPPGDRAGHRRHARAEGAGPRSPPSFT